MIVSRPGHVVRPGMSDVYSPPEFFRTESHCRSAEEYQKKYKQSVEDPHAFWSEIASTFHWKKVCQLEQFFFHSQKSLNCLEGKSVSLRVTSLGLRTHRQFSKQNCVSDQTWLESGAHQRKFPQLQLQRQRWPHQN